MKTLALVLGTLYLHQYIGAWSECLMGFIYGFGYAQTWRKCVVGAFDVGVGWLLIALFMDSLSDGRVEQIGGVLYLHSIEATYAMTFLVGFVSFLSSSLAGRVLEDNLKINKVNI